MIKGIIYDHDGTLINTEAMHYACWRDIMQGYGVDFPLTEYIAEHNGVPTRRNAEILIETYALSVDAEQLCNTKQVLSHQRFSEQPCPLMPFAQETIEASFKAGFALAIATGAGRKEIDQTMAAYALRHYFQTIATRDDVQNSKPAPDVYLLAQHGLGLAAKECIAIEDTFSGIRSAKLAGLRCIAVENEFSAGQDLSEADYHCDNIKKAFEWIQSLNQQNT